MASVRPPKRRHKSLRIDEKLSLLQEVDRKLLSKKAIAQKFGIPANTLSTILKNRNQVEKLANSSSINLNKKRMRFSKVEDIDNGLFSWYKQARAEKAPISGPILTEKATQIASEMEIKFTPSAGWLDRFKRRHGIAFKTINGESASISIIIKQEPVNDWSKPIVPNVLQEIQPDDESVPIDRSKPILPSVLLEPQPDDETFSNDQCKPILPCMLQEFQSYDETVSNDCSKPILPCVLQEFQPDDETVLRTSSKEARASLQILKKFVQEQGSSELLEDICSFEFKFEVHITQARQTSILDFFKKATTGN